MQTSPDATALVGSFSPGGGEIILILALVLILFGAKKLPELAKGLGEGISRFWEAVDRTGNDAGRSVGGIYGKRAAQAITPDNQVAELYSPAAFQKGPEKRNRRRELLRFLSGLWSRPVSHLGWSRRDP